MKVIFDTDPGIDDAMALLYLSKLADVELLGITTVVGNAGIEATTRNALFLREKFGISAPVVRGAGETLDGVIKPAADAVHGRNGLGDIELSPVDESGLRPGTAADFIIETLRAHPGEVTLVAVGRMTNLALALRQDPAVASLARAVIIMGGAFGYKGRLGNITPAAEANIHGDPVAADEVFAANWPVTVVGLDVTHEIVLSSDYLARLGAEGGPNGRLIAEMSAYYARFYREFLGIDGVVGHDLLAVTYLVHPELFITRSGSIRVVTDGIAVGETIQSLNQRHPAWQGRPQHQICTDVDADKALEHYWQVVVG